MAKRPSDDFDPFDDFGSDLDDSDIDSLRITDSDNDAFDDLPDMDDDVDVDDEGAPKPPKADVYRPRPTVGQIIVGAIQVIVFAAIFLVIFLAIGFGAVFGGQKVGLVPTRAPGGSGPLLALLPTAGAASASGDEATAAPNAPTATPLPPTATPDASCASATDWWNSQQVQSNYQYFAAAAINDARNSDKVPALLEQMRIRRNFVANVPIDPCLNDAQSALLKGFDATIEAARAIGAKDSDALATQQASATQAFNDMATALRKYGVTVMLEVQPTPGA
ncbi:MAG: hypothetical protein GC204_05685 [Chloroflexi bacterium]|nr:hypothetical protein [Chloroflexota bacterium]